MAYTRAGFVSFIRAQRVAIRQLSATSTITTQTTTYIQVTSTDLPDNSTEIDAALAWAASVVADEINILNPLDYNLAVYNLGFHCLILFSTATVFNQIRTAYNLGFMHPGFVQSTSDEGTSVSNMLPDFWKNLNPFELELSRTQAGRNYLSIASRYRDLNSFYA